MRFQDDLVSAAANANEEVPPGKLPVASYPSELSRASKLGSRNIAASRVKENLGHLAWLRVRNACRNPRPRVLPYHPVSLFPMLFGVCFGLYPRDLDGERPTVRDEKQEGRGW